MNKNLLRFQISLFSEEFTPLAVSLKMDDKFDSVMRKFKCIHTLYYTGIILAVFIVPVGVICLIGIHEAPVIYIDGIGDLLPNDSYFYKLEIVLTFMGNYYCVFGFIGVDCLFLYFIILACFQFDLLIAFLKPLRKNIPASQVDKTLKDFLKSHAVLMRFVENIGQCFELSASVEIIHLVITLCCLLFCIKENVVSLFTALSIPVAFQLVIYCMFGQEIINKSADLRSLLSNCNWKDWTISQRKTLIIILIANSGEVSIRAKGLVVLSLNTMTKIVQKSYETAAVLRSLK